MFIKLVFLSASKAISVDVCMYIVPIYLSTFIVIVSDDSKNFFLLAFLNDWKIKFISSQTKIV